MENEVTINKISYLLDKTDTKALIIRSNSASGEIIIPRSIKFENQEYIINNICERAFSYSEVTTIKFVDDSELKVINERAFAESDLEKIEIPPTVEEICSFAFALCLQFRNITIPKNSKLNKLGDNVFIGTSIQSFFIPSEIQYISKEWFSGLKHLVNVEIHPQNRFFMNYNNDFVIEKSDKCQINFDFLRFSRRNITNVSIPSFITGIGPFSFEFCKLIQKVDFSNDSKLKTIDQYAFSNSSLKKITLPKSIVTIAQYAFAYCAALKQVFFEEKSELKVIEKNAFHASGLESIFIPSSVLEIFRNSFQNCFCLRLVELGENSKLNFFPKTAFFDCKEVVVFIPMNSKIVFV